jgi:hypothetical protein
MRWLVLLVAAAYLAAAGAAGAQTTWYVDTAVDLRPASEHCTEGQPCPLRSAILRATEAGGGLVTARLCGAADDTGCLARDDRAYDETSGRWVLAITPDQGSIALAGRDVVLDFAATVPGWSDPGDNVLVIHGAAFEPIGQGLVVEGIDQVVRGVTLTGEFTVSAVEVRVGATGNTIDGLSVEGVTAPHAYRFRDTDTTANRMIGSWCGLGADGATEAPVSGDCVVIDQGAGGNTVGGEGMPNALAAAAGAGVRVSGSGANKNVVKSNAIGVDATGAASGPLAAGIVVEAGAGETEMQGNLVTGALGPGIRVEGLSFSNQIAGNTVGLLAADAPAHPNAGWGIELVGESKGTVVGFNVVSANRAGGIRVAGGGSLNNRITRNEVFDNGGPEIAVTGGANNRVEPPRISIVGPNRVTGTGCAGCSVEVFSGGPDGARHFEGETTVSVLGAWFFDDPDGAQGDYVSATQSQNENTSGLSAFVIVPGRATPTSSPGTPPPGRFEVHLPWSKK